MKPLLCLVLLAVSGIAQSFELGSSLDDVYLQFGDPKKWWEPEPQRYLTSFEDYRAAVDNGVVVQDVYQRETKTNSYEIRLIRRADFNDSRLQPKIRLSGLEFLVAKPGAFREILADLAEAREICAEGCSLFGLDEISRHFILACPINPIIGQTQGATVAAYGYKHDFPPGHTYNWCLMLIFEKRESFVRVKDGAGRDWTHTKVDSVEIRPASLDYELHTSTWQAKPQPLGSWKP